MTQINAGSAKFQARSKDRRAPPSRSLAFLTPAILLLLSLSIITMVWCWLAAPATLTYAPIDSTTKLDCISYAPFRDHQSPWNSSIIISPEQIAADLTQLAKISRCIRTYSVENGLDQVPELASKAGLKVLLGVWIGRDRQKNAQLIATALSLVKAHPSVVTAIIVGSEVLLRGEMSASDLRETIRSAKAQVDIPVSYADVWEFWLRYPEVSADVDFVTIHILPYWEDFPVGAENAAAHVDAIRSRVAFAFPGKEIMIGEAGWPSRGRMRDRALPSRINQARFVSEIVHLARQKGFRLNLFEAYDEPWKRQWEGTVGGSWGLFDGWSRELKYPAQTAVSNYPFWRLQLGCGLALSICVFGAAMFALWRRPSTPPLQTWIAVATSATVAGILVGVSAEKTLYEGCSFGDWLVQSLLLTAGVATPLLCSEALMSGRRAPPTFLELVGPRESRTQSVPTMILGIALTVTTLVATEIVFGLVFDPRSRDFPFAGFTMAVLPFWSLTLLNRPKSDKRPVAEIVFASMFAAAALYVIFNEGPQNWQCLWTSTAYFVLAAALWPVRSIPVVGARSRILIAFSKILDKESRTFESINVAPAPQRKSRSYASAGLAATSKVAPDGS